MKSLIQPLAAQLTIDGSARLVELWEVLDSQENTIGRFAVHDESISFGGNSFVATGAPVATALEHVSEFGGGDLDILAAFESGGITVEELRVKLAFGGTARRRVVDARFPDAGVMDDETFRVSTFAFDEDIFRITLQKIEAALNGPAGYTLSRKCRWSLSINDSNQGCFYSQPAPITATVASIIEGQEYYQFTVTFSIGPGADELINGRIVWTSGNNRGLDMPVLSNTATVITLAEDTPFKVQVGDEMEVYIGCDKTIARCNELGQVANFGGYPDIPGKDIMLDLPDAPGGV